jgi:hypothetical protein
VVSGIDDLGDVHIFATGDPERAREIVGIMGEELRDVKLSERTYGRPAAPDERRNDADQRWEGIWKGTMNRDLLSKQLSGKLRIPLPLARSLMNSLLARLSEALQADEEIKIREFGTFGTRLRSAG